MVSRHRSESPTPTEGPQPSKLGSTPWNSQPSKLGSTKYIQIHRAPVELAPPGAGARALGRSGFNPTASALLRQLVGLKPDLQTQFGLLPVVAHQQPSKLGPTPWNSQPSKLGSTVELAPPGAGARALGRSGFNPTALALLRQLVGLKPDLQTQLGLLPVVAHQQPSKLGSTPWNSQPGKLGSTRATAADSAERNGILKVPNPS